MAADVTTAVIGLIGAAVGSSVTMVGSYLNARINRDLARGVRNDSVRDAYRATCAAFLTRLDSLLDHAKSLVWATERAREAADTLELRRGYLREWAEFVAANAVLQLAVPHDIAKAAESLRADAEAFGAVVDSFVENSNAKRIPQDYRPSLERVAQTREQFIAGSRKLLVETDRDAAQAR